MKKSNSTLVAGPWIGEFGWELFAWQGYIRSLAQKYEKIVVISRESSKFLYEDFADEFISCKPPSGLSDSYFRQGVNIKSFCVEVLKQNKYLLNEKMSLFLPRRIGIPPHTHFSENVTIADYNIKPLYKKYGTSLKGEYSCIFHIRNRDLRKEDNWPLEKWKKLKSLLNSDHKIACIGSREESGYVEGTKDLRGINGAKLSDILASSEVVFGPSSGPMHLSSLCGAPHVVWSRPENFNRYKKNWNPFDTPVLFLGEHSWQPTAEYVYEKYSEWMKNDKRNSA